MPSAEFGITQVKLFLITEYAIRDKQFRFQRHDRVKNRQIYADR